LKKRVPSSVTEKSRTHVNFKITLKLQKTGKKEDKSGDGLETKNFCSSRAMFCSHEVSKNNFGGRNLKKRK